MLGASLPPNSSPPFAGNEILFDIPRVFREKWSAMARLIVKSRGVPDQVLELKLGVNKLGRTPGNDFQIDHPTISGQHCEITLKEQGIFVRDCDSTNGTFINGAPITEAKLEAGQILHIGDVELLVESVEVKVAIPQFDRPQPPAPPIVLTDGSLLCPRHPKRGVTHQCTHCREVMCEACVRRLRRRRGKLLKLCPVCGHPVEPLGAPKEKKRGIFEILQRTIKLPLLRNRHKRE